MFERKDYVITFYCAISLPKFKKCLFFYLKKKYSPPTHRKIYGYRDTVIKKCHPINKNIYIHPMSLFVDIYILAFTNLAVGIIVCRWRRKDSKFYRELVACAVFVCRQRREDRKSYQALIACTIFVCRQRGEVCKSYQVLVGCAIFVTQNTQRMRFYSNTVIYLLMKIKHIYFNTVIKT